MFDEDNYLLDDRICSFPCHVCGEEYDKINLELDINEARELADFLDGSDMRLSVGDRYFIARKLRRLADKEERGY